MPTTRERAISPTQDESEHDLPPRPDPQTGEPQPPRAPGFQMPRRPSKEHDASRETRLSHKPEPPPGQGPVLVWFERAKSSDVQASVWFAVATALFLVLYIGIGGGPEKLAGMYTLSGAWLWLMPIAAGLLMYASSRGSEASAGAEWLRSGRRAWIRVYELDRIRARAYTTGIYLDLRDSDGRALSIKLDDVQSDRDMWDLVYNGLLHSVQLRRPNINRYAYHHLSLPHPPED